MAFHHPSAAQHIPPQALRAANKRVVSPAELDEKQGKKANIGASNKCYCGHNYFALCELCGRALCAEHIKAASTPGFRVKPSRFDFRAGRCEDEEKCKFFIKKLEFVDNFIFVKNIPAAEQALKELLFHSIHYKHALIKIIRLYLDINDLPRAKKYIDLALAKYEDELDFLLLRTILLAKQNDLEHIFRLLREILKIISNTKDWQWLAKMENSRQELENIFPAEPYFKELKERLALMRNLLY